MYDAFDAENIDYVDLAEDVDIVDARGDTVNFDPIGVGSPLKVELVSVYVGETRSDRGELLVMSTAKDPDSSVGSVVAMNWWGKDVRSQYFVPLDNGSAGTRLLYYSPAESATSLSISVKLKFDYFPEDVFRAWTKAAKNIGTLPILIGGMALGGPVGAAEAQAIVGVAEAGANLGIALLDEGIDGRGLLNLDWRLSVADPGSVAQRAGYVLLTEQNREDRKVKMRGQVPHVIGGYTSNDGYFTATDGPKEFLEVDGNEFYVDAQDHVLRHVHDGTWDENGWTFKARDEVRGPWPYALVKAHGAEDDDLKKWKPAAVTAELAAKFLKRGSDSEIPDLTEKVFTAYSDVAMIDRAGDLQAKIDKEKDDTKKELLKKQLNALIDSIENKKLKKLVSGKE